MLNILGTVCLHFVCVCDISTIELYFFFNFGGLLFVSPSILITLDLKWLGSVTLVISFVSKGFPYKDEIEELLIVMVYCM